MDFTDSTIRHDRVIVVEGQRFYVYWGHLSFCSEFFATMFTADFLERNLQEIALYEIAAEDFHLFLKTLVPGNNSIITVDNYLPILACANRFMALAVLSMCDNFICENIDKLDKIELIEMAFEYNREELKEKLAVDLTKASPIYVNCPTSCSRDYLRTYCSKCVSFFNEKCPNKHSAKFYLMNCGKCASIFDSKSSVHLSKSSFLIKNKEKLAGLSDEINVFIFKALLNNADK